MARGWESKSIESQIESANARHGTPKIRLTREQQDLKLRQESLLLQRRRILRQIENCSDERYRKTLEAGLSYLETQLAALGWKATGNH